MMAGMCQAGAKPARDGSTSTQTTTANPARPSQRAGGSSPARIKLAISVVMAASLRIGQANQIPPNLEILGEPFEHLHETRPLGV